MDAARAAILAVDGGGSRSEARAWALGREVARATGGPLNPSHAGIEGSARAFRELLDRLRTAGFLGSGPSTVDAACIGLSGVSHPSSRRIVQQVFETAGIEVTGPRILVGDAEIVLEAAFGGAAPSGVVLVAGTGSMALARNASGRLARAGGLGPARGDAGGAHWVGEQARAAGFAGARHAADAPAAIARSVVESARTGDEAALRILRRAATELLALVAAVAADAGLGGTFVVRPSGGLASNSPQLVAMLSEGLASSIPGATLGPAVSDPLSGALALATRHLQHGGSVPRGW